MMESYLYRMDRWPGCIVKNNKKNTVNNTNSKQIQKLFFTKKKEQ